MSRVFRGERYVNMPHHGANITAPSKVVRAHCEGEDYHNADSLTSWLFMKFDWGWLQNANTRSSSRFCVVDAFGNVYEWKASGTFGVRPVFMITEEAAR